MSLADLGRRAVACERWEWLPGMVLRSKTKSGMQYYGRVCYLEEDDLYCDGRDDRFGPEDLKGAYPDLEDPATLGCLLALVRQAWDDEDLSADRVSRRHDKLPDVWQVYVWLPGGVKDVLSGRSEAEALVAALEAAP